MSGEPDMNRKVLIVATVPSMIGQFNMNNIRILQDLGCEVHVACNWHDRSIWSHEKIEKLKNQLKKMQVSIFQIEFSRTPTQVRNHVHSYKVLNQLILKQNYDFIHCHTPIAGAISRLVSRKNRAHCIYTAHGFHFFKGAAIKSWILFYPIEKWLSKYTDVLITINQEDYNCANKHFNMKQLKYVPGVGINIEEIQKISSIRKELLNELQLEEENKLLLSVGELNAGKNHQIVMKALALLPSNIHYVIAGRGEGKENLSRLAKELQVESRVHLLGFREDVLAIMKSCDIFVFPSLREGLPVALMEAMACGIPTICSDIRGNRDLINNKECLVNPQDVQELTCTIDKMINHTAMKERIIEENQKNILQFDANIVSRDMKEIYQTIIQE